MGLPLCLTGHGESTNNMQDARPNPTLDLAYCVERPIFMDFLQHADAPLTPWP